MKIPKFHFFPLKSGAWLETFTRYAQISKSTLPCLPERYVSIFFLQYGEVITFLRLWIGSSGSSYRGGSRIFLGGGALVSCSTSTPINHIVFFFWQNTSCIRKPQVISGRGGAHPLHPPPRSAPELIRLSRVAKSRN